MEPDVALNATIYKASLNIADIDHGYYAEHALTLALHPSETTSRLMARIVAFALNAHDIDDRCQGDAAFDFGKGLCEPGDPDMALVDFTQAIRLWIDIGQSDDKALAKACSRSDAVALYPYLETAHTWWKGLANKVSRLNKLGVYYLGDGFAHASDALVQRSMVLQATIQDGGLTLIGGDTVLSVTPDCWQAPR